MNEHNENLLYTYIDKFPKASILVGRSKEDKDDCLNYISTNLSMNVLDITGNVDYDYLSGLYLSTEPAIYTADLDNITPQKQNALLKFVEEPPASCYVVLTTSSRFILPTLKTRCVEFGLHEYSREEIEELASTTGRQGEDLNLLVNICETADDVKRFGEADLLSVRGLARNIIDNISKATLPNAISIANKYIYFKDPVEGKCSVELFTAVMSYVLRAEYCATRLRVLYDMYRALLNFKIKLLNKSLSREYLFEQLLIRFWEISRGEDDDHSST